MGGPNRGMLLEFGESVRPHRWAFGQTKELKTREAYDDSPTTVGQKKPPRSCRNTTETEDHDSGHPFCS